MICTIQQISKMLGGNTIFENLSLDIKSGDKLGIVGRNGSGKTTLFKLIAGVEPPDAGQIHYKKGTTIGYLSQIPSFEKTTSGYDVLKSAFAELVTIQQQLAELELKLLDAEDENLERLLLQYGQLQDEFVRRDGYSMDSEIEKVINGLQLRLFVERDFRDMSGGEQTKVMLGKLLLTQPDLLLLDEPTNHLDLFAVEWLEEFLADYAGTVVIISHDRYFLDHVVKKVADLEEGELHLYIGNYSSFIQEKEERLLREFQDYEEQQKKIKKMKEAIKRLRIWANEANPPNAGLHRQARNMERALERIEKIRKPLLAPKKMGLTFESAQRSGKEVVIIQGARKYFGEKELLSEADLLIYWKDRTAIVGRNGSGKSTILKMLIGQLNPDSGVCKLGSNVKVGFLSQHFEMSDPKERLIDTFREEVNMEEGESRHVLAKFMFYGPDVFKRVGDLSGGERMRLRLAQLMHQDVNLLVLDEPTNHLDIESREVLEDALEDFSGTILAVSHDRYFLNKLFTRTAWLEDGEITMFEGSFDWARTKWHELQQPKVVLQPQKPIPVKKPKAKEEIVEDREGEIEKLELRIHQLEQALLKEGDWESYELGMKNLYEMKTSLDAYYEMWMSESE
ncbi:ABC-F type ribosomal protection protein [Sporosarcina sp. Sa2YVA2]|uniref:ABC-F type ribosomal protection protein n=1 Tax=Sporosarcina quadrami TaxID=2762234 RepID=A0ABR8UBA5_9BACL|nr:ABC-F type ribosomal protection protein [Sporosarcina quadrami]MBD7985291.1 ABC-F type ribosomal protection protein [Sporosarcina quadrami]